MCFCEYFINELIRRIKAEFLTKKATKKPHIYEAFSGGPTWDRTKHPQIMSLLL